jgi:hypothetical protein
MEKSTYNERAKQIKNEIVSHVNDLAQYIQSCRRDEDRDKNHQPIAGLHQDCGEMRQFAERLVWLTDYIIEEAPKRASKHKTSPAK